MTPEQKYEIAAMTSEVHQKWLRFEAIAICNAFGLSPKEWEKRSIEYEIAKMEWLEANAELHRTQSEILNPR